MQKQLVGKIALITGASSGLGAAVAKRYIDEGAHLITIGRNLKRLEAIDDYAQEQGSSTTIVQLDLMDYPKIAELGQKIAQRFGHFTTLLIAHNAREIHITKWYFTTIFKTGHDHTCHPEK